MLAEGTLPGQGYVDALLAIKTSLNPVDREIFCMSSTNEFWRFYVRDQEIESILNPVADAQHIYIERLGGKVTPFMSGRTASELIHTLTDDPVACERASRIYEAERATIRITHTNPSHTRSWTSYLRRPNLRVG